MNINQNILISSPQRVWTSVVLITAVIIIIALLITHISLALTGNTHSYHTYQLAFCIPLITALPTSYLLIQALYQLQQAHHRVLQLAYTDELTALANRRNFFTQGSRLVKRGQPAALLLLDINNFKPINDTWGHAAGDDALRSIASVLQSFAQPDDLIARLGGDEFALLRPHATRQEMASLSLQIQQQLVQQPYEYHGAHLPLSISTGMSDTTQATTLEALLHISDMALYGAKVEHHQQTSLASQRKTCYNHCQLCPVG